MNKSKVFPYPFVQAPSANFSTAKSIALSDSIEGWGSTKLDNKDDTNPNNNNATLKPKSKEAIKLSIKCCLSFSFSIAIILSIVSITAVWITSFAITISDLSNRNRALAFGEINLFTIKFLEGVTQISEVAQSLMITNYNISDTDKIIKDMVYLYKSILDYQSTSVVTVYIGDMKGNCLGIMNVDNSPSLFQMWEGTGNPYNETWLTTCQDIHHNEGCVRSSKPDVINPRFNMTPLVELGKNNPGNAAWTQSYIDISMPDVIFMSMITSVKRVNESVSFYFGYDLSAISISKFLKEKLSGTSTTGFLLETSTDYIIASNQFSSYAFSTKDINGNIDRKTGITFGDPATKRTTEFLFQSYKSFREIECGKTIHKENGLEYVSFHRLCDKHGIDWVMVLVTPTWVYLGGMIISLIVAVGCSILIVILGVTISLIISIRISTPINDLVELFESVGKMELENLTITSSSFKEINDLHTNFSNMVKYIKLYRGFIPSHILAHLEEESATSKELKKSKHSMKRTFDNASFAGSVASVKSKFSLHLEEKKVSMVGIFIDGFWDWCSDLDPMDIIELLNEIYIEVNKVAKQYFGQLGVFDNGLIPISWNTATDTLSHEERAVKAAYQLKLKLKSIELNWTSINSRTKLYIAATSQEILCGNVGTEEVKNFTIIGNLNQNIHNLIEFGKRLNVPLLITDPLFEKIKTLHNVRLIGFQDIPYLGQVNNNELNFKELNKVYQLGEPKKVEMDEWMYELQKIEKLSSWKTYNEACNYLLNYQFSEALELFNQYLEECKTEDFPTFQFIDYCKNV
ncbi:hypothetical protein ABK040_014246 [Willaertia magna]